MNLNKLIDGKELSNNLLTNLKHSIEQIQQKRLPKIVIIQVGDNQASNKYIKHKLKSCEKIGMLNEHLKLDDRISQSDLLKVIDELNKNQLVDGIIVQLPLPNHIDTQIVNETIAQNKDADGFSPKTLGNVMLNNSTIFPATPLGIVKLLEWKNINLIGANVVIIGRSNIVGKPLANMLINKSATVTICNTKTKNLAQIASNADILVSAAGFANLITKDFVNPNSVVIDVGANFVEGKYCGDVNFQEVEPVVKLITPVPGGVGPMTIACLLENVWNLYKKNIEL
ncbi:bifunctional 5,10-methylenetetrahydrofolate dehydrogenase/5,10-methenyltetrahydrofolate cyclohydrolase [Spiroplasma culicicola]|uniref:Bifunctional protein FolD n=1 Tax=Spiroplasma culicicola AES-1 TaxID=1276246 RepID=W6A5W9_9MOLU|nr:bifunctional 5,10-methylenetetrahydrofolate dehydrogenase/5,10-methenyltetrahydrofolate cyclohydrolase [Spiroplasma culicicola]AHI52528.1 methylenetetrahydrofolate dehydrogenase/methylenetetrahydrofolate cyclohydrolase [Spiroplasma culicicola AES-1]